MANKVDSRKETIFPLSYNPKLDKDDIKGIDVYFNLLKSAFCNSRIRNIAVTGAYGIGKSSIIKSFDYVLPVVPVLNRKSSEVIFRNNLKKMDAALETDFRKEW